MTLAEKMQKIQELLKQQSELKAKIAEAEKRLAKRDDQQKFEALRREWDRAVQGEQTRGACSRVVAVQRASKRLPNLRAQYIRAYNHLHRDH